MTRDHAGKGHRARTAGAAPTRWSAKDLPMRGTLFTLDRLLSSARKLARSQQYAITKGPRITPLLPLLDAAEQQLTDFQDFMSAAVRSGHAIPPATEWLLDNQYLIEEQFLRVREDLPRGYGAELPHLVLGPLEGYPRIYEAMVALVEHTDARLDREYLFRYVQAFQEQEPLTIGEIWAIPIVLRVALVENLRRLAMFVRTAYEDDRAADRAADDLMRAVERDPSSVHALLERLDRECDQSGDTFFLRLHQRLRLIGTDAAPVATWLDGRIAGLHEPIQTLRTAEHHRQAADQVSVANSVTGIRFLGALDWRGFFEDVSLVERLLRGDPAGVYPKMTFLSRDRYRNAVEYLARRCPHDELEVARAVVHSARKAAHDDPDDKAAAHIGWHLVSEGRYVFEDLLEYRPQLRERIYRGPLRPTGVLFFALLAGLTAAFMMSVGLYAYTLEAALWRCLLLACVAAIPLSDIALALVNRLASAIWRPRLLPALDSRHGIGREHRVLVVTTTLVSTPDDAREAIARLEVNYLTGSQDPNAHFALVCELPDAPRQSLRQDEAVLRTAVREIERMNERHGKGPDDGPFHLFSRHRMWNEHEGVWMGWERKRGALWEINRYVRGAQDTSIARHVGDADFLPHVVFMLALDADTSLPRDCVRRLVSVIAHPLNRGRLDRDGRRVVHGYGLIQPRVGVSLPSAGRTFFSWMHTGVIGIDPYGGVVSDVYQDVFGEGSFNGKAVWDVDIFLAVLNGRVPENRLLSHDLLEGNYLRTGLVSDIEIFDDHPSLYASHTARLHRWVRGDWQTLPWLMPRVPLADGGSEPNPLSVIHRWKLLDNLRRSLVAPSLMAMIAAGWVLLPEHGPTWILTITGVIFFPAVMQFVDSLISRPRGVKARSAYAAILSDLRRDVLRAMFALSTLPHRSWITVDAITRALWRLLVSHRRSLEWTTAAEAEQRAGTTLSVHVRVMWPSLVAGLALIAPCLVHVTGHQPLAIIVALSWAFSPVVVHVSARRLKRPRAAPSRQEVLSMRRIARRTWRFFDAFTTEEDRWLIPDNFQEDPKGEIAHRTSPTNVGLQLLAYLSAYDLGYVGPARLIELTGATLGTLAGLRRFRSHFYNWYDTRTLEPLPPGYVSTVDSGNLAGHLLVLRQGLLEAASLPFIGPQVREGLQDTLRAAIDDAVGDRTFDDADETDRHLTAALAVLADALDPGNLGAWSSLLRDARGALAAIDEAALSLETESTPVMGARRAILDCFQELDRHRVELDECALWATLLEHIPDAISEASVPPSVTALLEGVPSLTELADGLEESREGLRSLAAEGIAPEWCMDVADRIERSTPAANDLLARMRLMADIAQEMWERTDFSMLYDPSRKLFSIGFNTAEGRLDDSYYDMLASECRLASFLAVAKGDVPPSHWFRLGRVVTTTSEGHALVSWSASMFEYLMPLLVMRSWPDTMLDETYYTVVKRQIQYGRQAGVPWGISESAFNAKDADLNYQYRSFGVPGLGLKRGLSDDVVVAPYATMLALPIDRRAALQNLDALSARGAQGYFGFYEAIDYTPGRIPAGAERAIVMTYMAHHQGMSLVSLANEITDYATQRRFHDDPSVRSAALLLHERTPRHVSIEHPHTEEVRAVRSIRELPAPVDRSYPTPHTPVPATHFLSNGSYSVMVTNAGGGYSRWRGLDVSRYREDVTRDCWGTFVYVRDVETGRVWSATYQPTCAEPDDYHVTFSADRAEYRRTDGDIETHTEIVVSPEDDVEIRRVTVTNHGRHPLTLELTSYFEVNLAPNLADQAHRTFSNLFVETEAGGAPGTLLFSRRPRSAEEPRVWGFHVAACDPLPERPATHETDRARFLGRLRQQADPFATELGGDLSGRVGAVIDPVCAIRQEATVAPGETVRVAFATGVAEERPAAIALLDKYRDIRSAQRALDLSWTSAQIVLRDLGISPEDTVVFQRLASRLLLTDPYSPLKVHTPIENGLPLSALWPLGISGDHPILLVRIERPEDTPLVRQVLLAHQYWRYKGLVADLVILNTRPSAYSDELHDRLSILVRTGHALELLDKPGGVFLRRADHMNPDVLNLLVGVARAVVDGDAGSLSLQLNQRAQRPDLPLRLVPRRTPAEFETDLPERPTLEYDNGIGGFDPETGEYVLVLDKDTLTPTPWVNVMANESDFGCMVSESGIGCTWALNSHENRLTTWNNDPVSDGSGEALYVRDEDTGDFWSPTPLPVTAPGPFVTRHGLGYTRFTHASRGIEHDLVIFVPPDESVRVARLTLTNRTDVRRTLSATQYVEWSVGESRSKAQHSVVTWFDVDSDMLTAHNHFNLDMAGRCTFLASDRPVESYTGSRTEFLGRNGQPSDPAAMHRASLGFETGRFHDAAGVLMVRVPLDPGQTSSVTFLLGQTDTLEGARALVSRFRAPGKAKDSLADTRSYWQRITSAIVIETPDRGLDHLVNGWLLYQTLSCRILGRTALYQSSGAFGFRDQLQDSLALLHVRPDLVRERIIEAARHQFIEGDVMHWWMPISGRGVRTRISDDRHWLPYAVVEYLRATGDLAVLDERIPFVSAPTLAEEQEDAYVAPVVSGHAATLYEHCVAALETAERTGPHGLPLMGGGDWNDGMNRVGIGGVGESVWLAWFLDVTLRRFADLSDARGDTGRAASFREQADSFVGAVERHGWDGEWYRRAYFDDGTPLGTSEARECRIDAIAQAWATISGRGDTDRAARALESVDEHLVDEDLRLIRLLHPPFDRTAHDPGYIKGYVPGVRENGGQYTHGVLWVALAHLMRGDADRGHALLDLLNPITHSLTRDDALRYAVEPYVIAADVYAAPPHEGRGGWTWYTGSAAWYWRIAVNHMCGLRVEWVDSAPRLVIDPCIPGSWKGFRARVTWGTATYAVQVHDPAGVGKGVEKVLVDGLVVGDMLVPLVDDGEEHPVDVHLM